MIIIDPWFYVAAIPAVLFTGISKAGFGGIMGGGLAVALMANVVAPPQAVAIMLPILLVMDAVGLAVFRGRYDSKNLRRILPGALLGLVIGTVTFSFVDARWVRLLVGVESVIFALDLLRRGGTRHKSSEATVGKGWFWSTVSGFTSFTSHSGGPPIMQYLLPQGLEHKLLVGTMVVYFSIVNFAKTVPYYWLGLIDTTNLGTSAALLPAVPLGYWVGLKLLHSLDTSKFNRVMTWLLLLTGIKLIFDAIRG